MKIKELLRTYLEFMMNKNRIISILLPIMLLASNVPAFGMFGQLAKNCFKTNLKTNLFKNNHSPSFKPSPHKIFKKNKITGAKDAIATLFTLIATTGAITAEAIGIPTLVDLRNNQPGPENNPYYSKWNPWKWYLGKNHQERIKKFGKEDASPENQELFRKALHDMRVKNPERAPIKIMNNQTLKTYRKIYDAFTTPTGMWLNPKKFNPNTDNLNPGSQYISYHEAAHLKRKHGLQWLPERRWLKLKARLLNYPIDYAKINEKISQRHEQEADDTAVFTLCKIGRRDTVEKCIRGYEVGYQTINNMRKSLQKWDKLQEQKKENARKLTQAIKTLNML